MAVLEPAGEEVAPIVWRSLLRPLAPLLGWTVAFGLAWIVDVFVRALFGTVNGAIGWIPFANKVVGAPIHSIEAKVSSALGGFVTGAQRHMGLALHGAAQLVDQLADTQVSVAVNLWHMATHLASLYGNAATGNLFKKAHTQATHATAVASSAVNSATRANHRAAAYAPSAVIPKVGRLEGEYEHLTDRVIPNLKARTRSVEDGLKDVWKAIRSNEKLLVTTAFAGAVAVAIGRLGMGWTRCSNWGRIGKSVCGLPGNLIDDLLGLLADFLILTNICDVIPWLERAFSEIAAPLIGTLAAAGAGLCKKGSHAAAPLTVPTLSLPSTVDATLHLG